MMHADIEVDEGLLDIMEKSYLYTSEHAYVAWIRGQRRTITVNSNYSDIDICRQSSKANGT